MCFINENKNFIRIKLYSEMKGLSDEEKKVKYLIFKDNVRNRLKKSYNQCNSKNEFYKDVFETIGFYEADYIFLNLFLDDDSVEIVNYLLDNNFTSSTFNFTSEKSLGYCFYDFFKAKNKITKIDINNFLKVQLIEKLEIFNELDWGNESEAKNPLMTEYSKYITGCNEKPINEITISFHLFVKMWNHFPQFTLPFNNVKAIMFYNDINKQINDSTVFYDFYKNILSIYEELFVIPNYIPLIDKKKSEYKTGYLNQRNSFLNNISTLKALNSLNTDTSYSDLLNKIIEDEKDAVINKSKLIIIDKIKNFMYMEKDKIDLLFLNNSCKEIKFLKHNFYYY